MTAAVLVAIALLLWPRWRAPMSAGGIATPDGEPSGWRETRWISWLPTRRAAARQRWQRDVVLLLDQIAPALRSGLPPAAAAEVAAKRHTAGQTRDLADALVRSARHGGGWSSAWRAAAERHQCADLHMVGAATALSERLGSPLADAIWAAAGSMRASQRRAATVASAAAAARATVNLLTALPLGGVLLASALGLSPASVYGTRLGVICAVLAVALTVAGRVLTAKLVNRVVEGPP